MSRESFTTEEQEQEKRAHLEQLRAIEWIRENQDAYSYMFKLADQEARAERKLSIAWLFEQMRKKDFTRSDGKPAKGISNTLQPFVVRVMVKEAPHLRPFVTLHKSRADMVDY